MSTERTERTRASILDAARKLIEVEPHEWTMEGVGDAAGVTRMTVYRYFPSRVELLVETARHVDEVEGAAQRFEQAHQAASGIETLDAWIRAWANYIPHIAPMANALMAARGEDEAAAEAWHDRMTSLRRGPSVIADRLHREGELAEHLTVDEAADLIWAIGSFQVWDALTVGRGWSGGQYEQHLSTALRRAVTKP